MLICDPMVVVRRKGKEGWSRDVRQPYIPAIRRMAARAQSAALDFGPLEAAIRALLLHRCVRAAYAHLICAPGMSGMHFRNCAVLAGAQQGGF
jgi:hypothetical protein